MFDRIEILEYIKKHRIIILEEIEADEYIIKQRGKY